MNENYTVNSLEEMPKALSYLIEKVDSLQKTVNTLRNKQQVSESPRWMNIDELCAYHPSHPKKQTVYEWVSKKTIPYHKMTKGLMFLQSEIDEWLKSGAQKTEEDLLREARAFIESKEATNMAGYYTSDFWKGMEDLHEFSFYRKPILNVEPCRAITVVDVYRYIVGHYAKPQTETLRAMTSPSDAKKFKATHFDYCTFSGLFRRRNEKEIILHSGLMCLDFDHIGNPEEFKELLLQHDYFDTELMFTSPSGDGVKWIIPIELKGWEHSRYFKAVANCIKATGFPDVDKSGSDVARSCFLPYDPHAYINPKYADYVEENIFTPRMGECPF